MTQSQGIILGLALAGVVGVLVPRLLARYRLARAVQSGLNDEREQEPPDMERAARYHVAAGALEGADRIDDATWSDLDLDEVFASLDRTESQVGRQYLYHLLRSPRRAVDPLMRLEATIERFVRSEGDLTQVRATLGHLADVRASHLVELLFGPLPTRPALWWIFPTLTATAVGCLALLFVWPKMTIVWLGVSVTNIAVQMYYRPRVRPLIVAFQAVPALVRTATQLASLQSEGLEAELAVLRDGARTLAPLQRATSWLLFEPGTANEMASTLYEYVNLLFLLDINAFVFSAQRVSDARTLLRETFASIGQIDVAQSVERWRRSLPECAVPTFTEAGKSLTVKGVYHPLLRQPVTNSLTVDGASILITGSNMSGKTTFMRTLGVNAVLAQTLHTTCASCWSAPFLCVRTSIGRADSLLDGKSHYLAEVESVHSLIRAKRAGRQHLFIIDEMFRGTNTAERIAAAYAVLAYLTQGEDIVVVATHDVELLPLLRESYEAYHFRESIEADGLSFDFQLRAGQSSTRNAIALLKVMRYPDSIVDAAMEVLGRDESLPGNLHQEHS